MLCGWERILKLNWLFCLSSTLILSIWSSTLFAWFLICFWNHAFIHLHLSIMPSYICIFHPCFHVVCLFLSSCLVFILFVFQNKKRKIRKIQKQCVFVYIGTCVLSMAIKTKFSKLCIICNLDEHLYAQLSKWALWLLFVMSKIKLSLVLNTHITLLPTNLFHNHFTTVAY